MRYRITLAVLLWFLFTGPAFAVCTETVVGSNVTVECFAGDTTWTVRGDYNCLTNTIEVWGGGGGGGGGNILLGSRPGGGGGAKSIKNNLVLAPGAAVPLAVGVAGTGGTCGSGDSSTDGGSTWFNGSALNVASVSAHRGRSGGGGGEGGLKSLGIGDTKYSGGNGGAFFNSGLAYGAGGGAAGGPGADGANGGDASTSSAGTGGAGSGDSGSGGNGGANPNGPGSDGGDIGGAGGSGGFCASGGNGKAGRVKITYVQANNCGQGRIIFHAPF